MYGKQYIYSCSIQNKLPSLTGLLYHLKLKYDIEKCIFFKNSEIWLYAKFHKLQIKKNNATYLKKSTQTCSKIIPELIHTLRIKHYNCLKYIYRCRIRWGFIFGLSKIRSFNMLYIQWSVEVRFFFQTWFLCSNLICIFHLSTVLKLDL